MSVVSVQTPTILSPNLDQVKETSQDATQLPQDSKDVAVVATAEVKEIEIPAMDSEVKAKPGPPSPSIAEKAKAAAAVLNRYRIKYKNDWDMPESITYAETQIEAALGRLAPIELVIPAFPFKSSNRSKKVLGPLPDEAERTSLLHLNGLCLAIKDATGSDAVLTIVSDGIVYNDILNVSDEEVWNYGQQLREMAVKNDCHCIRFARVYDIVGSESTTIDQLDKASYLAEVSQYRDLIQTYIPTGFDVSDAIATDTNTLKTYMGYKKFLISEREERPGRSRSQMERENAEIAKSMVKRGKAFAEIVKLKYSASVRLSIHPSNDTNKISIKMLPQDNEICMTPWHGAVVRGANGSVSMTHALSVPAMTHEVINVDGQPSYFREKSDVFNWPGMDVTFEYLYPCGIMIKPAHASLGYTLSMVDMQKIRTLAETSSPIVLRGFANTKDRHAYVAKAHDLGEIFMWKSLVTVVKDDANTDPGSSVAFSSEAMPMHFDGIFKVVKVKDEKTGEEKKVSDPPRFQYFVSQSAAQPGDGYTLFASSDLVARYLPQAYPIESLEKYRWTCNSYGHYHHVLGDIPLVVRHPTRNTPCLRWHQPWPKHLTAFGHAEITIDNGSQSLIPLVDRMLYDRRVCLRFSWNEGDILVSDNTSMLHTRTAFSNAHPRELWRIHTH